ncbi:unnamed protein product, partial [Prorocentrum cordatum]
MALLVAGMMLHGILPRAWRLAFGDWNSPQHAVDGALDDYAKMGGSIKVLAGAANNPALNCMAACSAFMFRPVTTTIATLARHFYWHDAETFGLFLKIAHGVILLLSRCIWRRVRCRCFQWPFRLARLADPDPTVRRSRAEDLHARSECCFDKGMGMKIRTFALNAAGLVENGAALAAVSMWSDSALACNVIQERASALIRRSSALRRNVERLISNGFLAAILPEHLRAGGSDVRAVARGKLIEMGAPIQCAAKKQGRAARAKASDRQLSFPAWANSQTKGARFGSRAEYRAKMAELKAEWAENGPRGVASRRRPRGRLARTCEDRIGGVLMDLSSKDEPIRTDSLAAEVRRATSRDADDARPIGLTENLDPVRQKFLSDAYVKDS